MAAYHLSARVTQAKLYELACTWSHQSKDPVLDCVPYDHALVKKSFSNNHIPTDAPAIGNRCTPTLTHAVDPGFSLKVEVPP